MVLLESFPDLINLRLNKASQYLSLSIIFTTRNLCQVFCCWGLKVIFFHSSNFIWAGDFHRKSLRKLRCHMNWNSPKWIHFIKPKQRIIFILVSPRKLYSSPETETVNCGTFRTKTHSAYFTLLQYPFKISTKGTKMQSACRKICSFWPWSKLCVNCFSFLCLLELHLSLPRSSDLRLYMDFIKTCREAVLLFLILLFCRPVISPLQTQSRGGFNWAN